VVHITGKTRFSARQVFQEPFSRLCAFLLQFLT
jgi:hypothetical protein